MIEICILSLVMQLIAPFAIVSVIHTGFSTNQTGTIVMLAVRQPVLALELVVSYPQKLTDDQETHHRFITGVRGSVS